MKIMEQTGTPIPTSGAAPVGRRQRQLLSPEEAALAKAWEVYFSIFKKITNQLPSIQSLDLRQCSPPLSNAAHLEIGVPGTYRSDGTCVRVRSFKETVNVIKSKQRPRKMQIFGEDGNLYHFLLKGHEDLRQDERAMQVFGLVNSLLVNDRRTENYDLSIQRYAIIPLSPTVGLISWVPQCDTVHDLIKEFRDSRKVILNVEHKLMQQMAPNNIYDSLTKMQKLEVFEYALANTEGADLQKILWYRSETSETWLLRRSCYTRSLAVMSMVGYILGLGDRHPSNLMLHRVSGKILHIDFGDCFEVAMLREKFPEKVPFRLTRMLTTAMEVSGIEGNYRLTCERTMAVLRENRDSLVAMLEAFVYDPLISWKLLNNNDRRGPEGQVVTGKAAAATINANANPNANAGAGMATAGAPTQATKVVPQTKGVADSNSQSNTKVSATGTLTSTASATLVSPATLGMTSNRPSQTIPGSAAAATAAAGGNPYPVLPSRLGQSEPPAEILPSESDSMSSTMVHISGSIVSGNAQASNSPGIAPSTATGMPPPPGAGGGFDGAISIAGATDDSSGPMPPVQAAPNPSVPATTDTTTSYRPQLHLEMQAMAQSLQNPAVVSMSINEAGLASHRELSVGADTMSPSSQHWSTAATTLTDDADDEGMTERAVTVIRRVTDKLTGLDFLDSPTGMGSVPGEQLSPTSQALGVEQQVDKLIMQASANENLSLSFLGWCPFW